MYALVFVPLCNKRATRGSTLFYSEHQAFTHTSTRHPSSGMAPCQGQSLKSITEAGRKGKRHIFRAYIRTIIIFFAIFSPSINTLPMKRKALSLVLIVRSEERRVGK